MPTPIFDPSQWPIAWMARAERQHARNATLALAPLGLHHREFRLLAFLSGSEGLTVGELAEMAVLERPTVSKMLDRLQAQGWVVRQPDAADRRRSELHLTESGQALLAQATPVVEALFRRYQEGQDTQAHAEFVAAVKAFFERVRDAQPPSPHDIEETP